MNAMLHIRMNVFRARQTEMAAIAGVSPATISKWERGEFEPTRRALARIREEAIKRGIRWDDSLFFIVPTAEEL